VITKYLRVFLSLITWAIALERVSASDPFDGKSLDAWSTLDNMPAPKSWEIVDGQIHLRKDGEKAGHIVTKEEFRDFSLEFEWKIAKGGNSGIKYRVRTYGNRTLGCEYQIYDDLKGKKVDPKNSAGALYDLYEPSPTKQLKADGEWNSGKIVVRGKQIEHWLNGEQVVSAVIGDDEWNKRVGESKFHEYTGFSEQPLGKIMLTDHGSEVWFRNVVFKSKAE